MLGRRIWSTQLPNDFKSLLLSEIMLRGPFIVAAGHICNILRQLGEAFVTRHAFVAFSLPVLNTYSTRVQDLCSTVMYVLLVLATRVDYELLSK